MELTRMSVNELRSVAFDLGVIFDENTSKLQLIVEIQREEALREYLAEDE